MSDEVQHGKDHMDPRRLPGQKLRSLTPELIAARVGELEQEIARDEELLREIGMEGKVLRESISDRKDELGALKIVSNLFEGIVPKRVKKSRRTREERIALECLEQTDDLQEACEEAHIEVWQAEIERLLDKVDILRHCIKLCKEDFGRRKARQAN